MELTSTQIAEMVRKVLDGMDGISVSSTASNEVPVGVSNRHIHLNKADLETLFGAGYELTPLKDLSQPGQYACKELLTLVGPSLRPIENVSDLVDNGTTLEFTLKTNSCVSVEPSGSFFWYSRD